MTGFGGPELDACSIESHASELACIRIDAARNTHIKNCTGNRWKIIVQAASKSARAADALIVFDDPRRGGGWTEM